MIFWFSGTGNSLAVAEGLSRLLNGKLSPMGKSNNTCSSTGEDSLGFVFPVYSWGVPPNVLKFIEGLPEDFIDDVKRRRIPVWAVITYGDEAAMTPEMLEKTLAKRGLELMGIWGVQMPNNYVLLPGFDVDSKEVERAKLDAFRARVEVIADEIKRGEWNRDFIRGSYPRLKTMLVWPLFRKWGMHPGKWYARETCVGCGICSKACPQGNIDIVDRRPVWGDDCVSCLACYHSCPRHAVEYGKSTKRKGQYFLKNV